MTRKLLGKMVFLGFFSLGILMTVFALLSGSSDTSVVIILSGFILLGFIFGVITRGYL
jgi:hypothetical protein